MTLQELFTDEDKWCKRRAAINKNGKDCLVTDSNAVSFCLWGGLRKCYGLYGWSKIYRRIELFLGESPVKWQDRMDVTFKDLRRIIEFLDI